MQKKATVVGAGLVGSLWTILLAKRGYQVNVYERREDMRKAGYVGGRSINLALSHRGFRGLERAGIAEEVRAVGIPMYGRMMHDLAGKLTYQAYGKEGEAIYSVSRGGLNIAMINLAEKFANVHLQFGVSCTDVDLTTGHLTLVENRTQQKINLHNQLTFATDGAFSAVRNALQKRPRFNYSQDFLEAGYKELEIPAGENGTYLLEKNALHIWPRGQFMLIALPNLDGSFTCTLFLAYEGKISFSALQTKEEIAAFFTTYFADIVPLIPDLVEMFQRNPVGDLVTVRCNQWAFQDKILMLGDAAHAIVPFFGQGMNAGFEDCVLLDEMANEHEEDWAAIFQEFSASRPKDTNGIANLALRNFIEMRDLVADPAFLLRQKIAAWLHTVFPEDFLPSYSVVTFSHTPYSEAWEEALAQDKLFERVLALPDIENNWQTAEVKEVFMEWLTAKQKETA